MRYTLALIVAAALCSTVAVAQVEIPEGFEIVEINRSDYFTGPPAINACGQIVFHERLTPESSSGEIFLYDNGNLVRITENSVRDRSADINDAGTLVWMRKAQPMDTQLVYYENGMMTILDNHRRGLSSGSINNLGQVAWSRVRKITCHTEQDIMFWNGVEVTQITDDRFNDQAACLNDYEDIAWGHADFCVNPWVGDIRLWSDGRTIVLPSNFLQVQRPSINNVRQVAWRAPGGVEFWEDGKTVLLIYEGVNPKLNNLGDIYFIRFYDANRSWDAWLYRVSDGNPRFYRLTDEDAWNTDGDINDWGEVVWSWAKDPPNWAGGIRLLRRIRTGDADFDGDVDLVDYTAFADCMTGPGRVDRLCDCRFLDIDHDGDVDLADFARFQNGFTGE